VRRYGFLERRSLEELRYVMGTSTGSRHGPKTLSRSAAGFLAGHFSSRDYGDSALNGRYGFFGS
jgi:hypothetical protein